MPDPACRPVLARLQGLSGMVRDGSPLHQPVLGSLAGVALEASRAWLNAGYFAKGRQQGRAWVTGQAPLLVNMLVLTRASGA